MSMICVLILKGFLHRVVVHKIFNTNRGTPVVLPFNYDRELGVGYKGATKEKGRDPNIPKLHYITYGWPQRVEHVSHPDWTNLSCSSPNRHLKEALLRLCAPNCIGAVFEMS